MGFQERIEHVNYSRIVQFEGYTTAGRFWRRCATGRKRPKREFGIEVSVQNSQYLFGS
jgi:hypothetical protein